MTYKICPQCHGAGKVLCDGFEYHRALHKQWAESWHLKPVIVRRATVRGDTFILGLAVVGILPGGWGAVKVYIDVTDSLRSRSGSADFINGKFIWYILLGWSYREDLQPLVSWAGAEQIQEIMRLTEGAIPLLGSK